MNLFREIFTNNKKETIIVNIDEEADYSELLKLLRTLEELFPKKKIIVLNKGIKVSHAYDESEFTEEDITIFKGSNNITKYVSTVVLK